MGHLFLDLLFFSLCFEFCVRNKMLRGDQTPWVFAIEEGNMKSFLELVFLWKRDPAIEGEDELLVCNFILSFLLFKFCWVELCIFFFNGLCFLAFAALEEDEGYRFRTIPIVPIWVGFVLLRLPIVSVPSVWA